MNTSSVLDSNPLQVVTASAVDIPTPDVSQHNPDTATSPAVIEAASARSGKGDMYDITSPILATTPPPESCILPEEHTLRNVSSVTGFYIDTLDQLEGVSPEDSGNFVVKSIPSPPLMNRDLPAIPEDSTQSPVSEPSPLSGSTVVSSRPQRTRRGSKKSIERVNGLMANIKECMTDLKGPKAIAELSEYYQDEEIPKLPTTVEEKAQTEIDLTAYRAKLNEMSLAIERIGSPMGSDVSAGQLVSHNEEHSKSRSSDDIENSPQAPSPIAKDEDIKISVHKFTPLTNSEHASPASTPLESVDSIEFRGLLKRKLTKALLDHSFELDSEADTVPNSANSPLPSLNSAKTLTSRPQSPTIANKSQEFFELIDQMKPTNKSPLKDEERILEDIDDISSIHSSTVSKTRSGLHNLTINTSIISSTVEGIHFDKDNIKSTSTPQIQNSNDQPRTSMTGKNPHHEDLSINVCPPASAPIKSHGFTLEDNADKESQPLLQGKEVIENNALLHERKMESLKLVTLESLRAEGINCQSFAYKYCRHQPSPRGHATTPQSGRPSVGEIVLNRYGLEKKARYVVLSGNKIYQFRCKMNESIASGQPPVSNIDINKDTKVVFFNNRSFGPYTIEIQSYIDLTKNGIHPEDGFNLVPHAWIIEFRDLVSMKIWIQKIEQIIQQCKHDSRSSLFSKLDSPLENSIFINRIAMTPGTASPITSAYSPLKTPARTVFLRPRGKSIDECISTHPGKYIPTIFEPVQEGDESLLRSPRRRNTTSSEFSNELPPVVPKKAMGRKRSPSVTPNRRRAKTNESDTLELPPVLRRLRPYSNFETGKYDIDIIDKYSDMFTGDESPTLNFKSDTTKSQKSPSKFFKAFAFRKESH